MTVEPEIFNDETVNIADPEKTKWSFYIRFKVSEPLGIDQDSINFLEKFVIKSGSDLSLKETNILMLENTEPLIYREIIEVSTRVERALMLAFANLGIGTAYAENLASEKILEEIRNGMEKVFRKKHTTIHDNYYEIPLIHWSDKFGIVLFQADSLPWDTQANQETDPIDTIKIDRLFKQYYNQFENIHLGDNRFKKIEIATKILTTSLFDDSLINRIILSMTVIEVLSDKTMRADAEIGIIDDLINKMNEMDIDNAIKKSLTQSLSSIKFQSISKSCKSLVKKLLGKKDAEKFYKLYDYRSQIVHSGILSGDQQELYAIFMQSNVLAEKLLIAYIKNASENSYV